MVIVFNRASYPGVSHLLPLVSLALLLATQARGEGKPIGLDEVLNQWRSRQVAVGGISANESVAMAQTKSEAWLAERRDFKITGSYEQSLRKLEDSPSERSWSAGVSRRVVAFPSSRDIAAAFEKEGQADGLEIIATRRGSEQTIARAYADLLRSQILGAHLDQMETELRPHIAAAERAARTGGLSHLAFRRWQLFQQALLSQKELALARQQEARDFLVNAGAATVQALSGGLKPIAFDRSTNLDHSLSIDAIAAGVRRDAALAQLRVAGDRREVELSVQFKRSLANPEDRSIQAGIAVPLDGGLTRASAGKQAEANLRLATLKAATQEESFRQDLHGLLGRHNLNVKSMEILSRRVLRTRELYTESLTGFRKGQIDFSEVVESLKGYHEASIEKLNMEADQGDVMLALLSLTNSGPFALVWGNYGR